MNNLKAERTLTAFDAWFNEQEGYSLRSERFEGDVEWLKAAFEAGALSTQQPMGEVRVKALEWSSAGPTTQAAETILGWYHIDRRWNMEDAPVWYWKRSGGWLSACETEGEAKAAAQADYEARILSALEGEK